MGIQNSNYKKYTADQKKILLLEQKYFDLLYRVVNSKIFSNELRSLSNSINTITKYVISNAKKTNPCDLAVQRLLQYRLFRDAKLRNIISGVYPSTISSDVAFISKDAVINIDTKTTYLENNEGDWSRKIVGKNQSSFKHKNYARPNGKSAKIEFLLDQKYGTKPVLSYVLSLFYTYNKITGKFDWVQKSPTNIKFACIPNGDLSNLFNNEIIFGVKHYQKNGNSDSVRIDHNILSSRFDKNGKNWIGFQDWKI